MNAADLTSWTVHTMRELGYVVFTRPWSLNIVGVRSTTPRAGEFDDAILAFYHDDDGRLISHAFAATTDPGTTYLKTPLNSKGTAILKPGQYRSSHTLGKHRNRYEALVQRLPLPVWRDDDRDDVIEHLKDDYGLFGINIHASVTNPYIPGLVKDRTHDAVGPWSAGCQVFASAEDYREFMELVHKSAARFGPNFSYTLLEHPGRV